MKQEKYTDLSLEDLKDKLNEKTNALNKLRHTHTISPIENPLLITSTRKEVARVQTELTKRLKGATK
jgi:large subunit ribosomal protein L29